MVHGHLSTGISLFLQFLLLLIAWNSVKLTLIALLVPRRYCVLLYAFVQWKKCVEDDWKIFELGHSTYQAVSYALALDVSECKGKSSRIER